MITTVVPSGLGVAVMSPIAALAPPVIATPPFPAARPGAPQPRSLQDAGSGPGAEWRLPSDPSSIPGLRRRLRTWLVDAGVDEDQTYDLLLATCEAATNAIEHAQEPTEPYVVVCASVADGHVRISVRDYGQWRERVPSMDRGRGSTLMSAFGEIRATPSPEGTTVVITSTVTDARRAAPAG